MKHPKLFPLILSLVLASLILAACGGGGAAVQTQPAQTTEAAGAVATEAGAPAQEGVVRVATDATWAPFEFVDESTKELAGFDIDLMRAIAERGGFQVELINVPFDPLLAGMGTCQYDAAISSITIRDDRKEKMNFSDPYFAGGQIVTVRADNTDITGPSTLSGKSVGAQIGTTGAIEISEMEGVTQKTYDEIGLAFQDLINGQIDAVIADNPVALGYVGNNPDKLKTVGEVFTDENYGIAVCKTNADLLVKINQGLAAAKEDGIIDQLTQKWLVEAQ